MATILCVDDEAASLRVVEATLQRAGHQTVGVRNVAAALNVLARGGVDLVVSDYKMPDATGLDFLEALEEEGNTVPLLMVTGFGTIEHAVAAIKAGAVDYLTKPFRPEQLQLAVEQALEVVRLRRENAQLREEVTRIRQSRQIIGESEPMKRVLETIRTVAPTRASVLIEGESGTGKELLARAVHDLSDRAERAFVAVNCAALPEALVESTLFGHEKGAFTGAVKQVKGAFERAHGGTLLLDEVTEMRPDLQAKLLRVLQEQEFERVGGTVPVRVDARIVATTNRKLREAVASGAFREDLYYRLAVVPVVVPPLRERLEDVPALVQHFARRAAAEVGKRLVSVTPETVDLLQAYDWPGNVRELAHAVERAVILSPGTELRPEAFDRPTAGRVAGPSPPPAPPDLPKGDGDTSRVILRSLKIADAEEVLIERALQRTGQNRTRAAELLGISVRTLRNKLNRPH